MGACASKPKEFDKKRIPPVAPPTPRKPDPETLTHEDEKASEDPAVEPSDSAAEAPKADEVAAGDVVPEEATAITAEEAAVEKPAEAIDEKPVAEEKTISEVVINDTKTTTSTEEEIKTQVPVVEAH